MFFFIFELIIKSPILRGNYKLLLNSNSNQCDTVNLKHNDFVTNESIFYSCYFHPPPLTGHRHQCITHNVY